MITIFLGFVTAALVSLGLYRLAEAVIPLPSAASHKALLNIHGKVSFTRKLEHVILEPISNTLSKLIPMSEYRRKRTAADLDRLGRKESPEQFTARIMTHSLLLCLLGLLFIPLGFPILTLPMAVVAVLAYFRSTQELRKKVEHLNEEIEAELPRMVETLNYSLSDSRDLISFFEKYRSVAGPTLGRELDRLLFEMRTGNHAAALRNLDARLQIPSLSALISILCGVHMGVDPKTSLLLLEQDMRTRQRERLRREAGKRPDRIKAASFLLTIFMILLFMVPLALLILRSVQSTGL